MNAIGADHQIEVARGAVFKAHGDAIGAFGQFDDAVAKENFAIADRAKKER